MGKSFWNQKELCWHQLNGHLLLQHDQSLFRNIQTNYKLLEYKKNNSFNYQLLILTVLVKRGSKTVQKLLSEIARTLKTTSHCRYSIYDTSNNRNKHSFAKLGLVAFRSTDSPWMDNQCLVVFAFYGYKQDTTTIFHLSKILFHTIQ